MIRNHTDILMACFLLLFFALGWRQGFLRVVLGPVVLVVCSIFAVIDYDLNHNLFRSLAIALGGTMGIVILLKILFFFARHTVDKMHRDQTFWFSRLLGGLINMVWKGSFLFAILLAISSFPLNIPKIKEIKDDIKSSRSMGWLNTFIFANTSSVATLVKTSDIIRHPTKHEEITNSPEYQNFISDEKVQAILADQRVSKLIDEKDFIQLLSHPKIKDFLKDKQATQKLTQLTQQIYREGKKTSGDEGDNK